MTRTSIVSDHSVQHPPPPRLKYPTVVQWLTRFLPVSPDSNSVFFLNFLQRCKCKKAGRWQSGLFVIWTSKCLSLVEIVWKWYYDKYRNRRTNIKNGLLITSKWWINTFSNLSTRSSKHLYLKWRRKSMNEVNESRRRMYFCCVHDKKAFVHATANTVCRCIYLCRRLESIGIVQSIPYLVQRIQYSRRMGYKT